LEQVKLALQALSIKNTICIGKLNIAKPYEPSWELIPISPTLTQTMHLWKFRKHRLKRLIYAQLDY